MVKKSSLIALLIACFILNENAFAQQSLSIEQAFNRIDEEYPLSKQFSVLNNELKAKLKEVDQMSWPKMNLVGQASYQSDVTSLDISLPGFSSPAISKDQYRAYAEVNQSLSQFFYSKQYKNISELEMESSKKGIESQLVKAKETIINLYFNSLLIDKRIEIAATGLKDIDETIAMVETSIQNGVALETQLLPLQNKKLELQQNQIELRAKKKALRSSLALLINTEIDEVENLVLPSLPDLDKKIDRIELQQLDQQSAILKSRDELSKRALRPELGLFVQSGVGRPALNMLNNDFDFYYIAGLRVKWNISSFYTQPTQSNLIKAQAQKIDVNRENFSLAVESQLVQITSDIERLAALKEYDAQLVANEQTLVELNESQLEQGTLTSTEYVRQIRAKEIAEINQHIHQIELIKAHYLYNIVSGGIK